VAAAILVNLLLSRRARLPELFKQLAEKMIQASRQSMPQAPASPHPQCQRRTASDWDTGAHPFMPARASLRQQQDHRRTHIEAPEFGAALKCRHGLGSRPAQDASSSRRRDAPGPDSLNAANEDRAHQHQRHRPEIGLERTDQAFVAREESRYSGGGGGVHAEETPGDMDGAAESPVYRHVDAVIVTRRQIQRGKHSTVETCGKVGVAAEQLGAAEILPLGLKNTPRFDIAELADNAVYRWDDGTSCLFQGSCICSQGPGEEGVEIRIPGRVRLARFAHVDPKGADVAPDQPASQHP